MEKLTRGSHFNIFSTMQTWAGALFGVPNSASVIESPQPSQRSGGTNPLNIGRHFTTAKERTDLPATRTRGRLEEQTLAVEVTEHAVAHGVLKLVPVGGREMGGLVDSTEPSGSWQNTPSMTQT